MNRPPLGARLILGTLLGVMITACGNATVDAPYSVIVEKNVPAEMRDGVVLRADVYRPDAAGSFPAMLRRTPYSKNAGESPDGFREWASKGYVVVVQDTRGRYASEGVAVPHDEAEDGYDTVEWVASLPGVNGEVGMWGGSYLATTQLTAAGLAPPSLVAIAPHSSYTRRYDMVFQGGAFYLSDGLGWNLGQAADVRRRRAGASYEERDGPIGLSDEERTRLRDEWLWHVPLLSLDVMDLDELAPGYSLMLEHPSYDDFWSTYDVGLRHDRFEVPALHTTGWYDTLLRGTLGNYRGIAERGATDEARNGQRIIIGPWTHSSPTLESRSIGGVDFGPEAGMDYAGLLDRWFEHWLRGGDSSVMDFGPVRLFVMGTNEWRDEPGWPLDRAVPTPLYLHSGGQAGSDPEDGRLEWREPGQEPADTYVYDPADPVPTFAMSGYSRAPYDPTPLQSRPDVVVYTSEPVEEAMEVTGYIELVLWVSSSAPDTDFTGKLIDVAPDGTARTLTDGILRARYRNGSTKPELLTPGQPVELRIDLLATSNVFLPGHRIRVEVSSSNFPRFDRNPNTGAEFGVDAELRTAEQTIYHDSVRPSHLLLPLVPPA
ncbi:MAG: CocE/NonD family hydrolase [Gemmatimonadetes bacterium]|nr:CocE/NonD family hydrolase [Gemmatimonadota bacterium]